MLRILLIAEKFEDAKVMNNALNTGSSVTWGWFGWCIVIAIVCLAISFLKKMWGKVQEKKKVWKKKEELNEEFRKINFEIRNMELYKEKVKSKKRQKLEKELKELREVYKEINEELEECYKENKKLENEFKEIKDKLLRNKIVKISIIFFLVLFFFFNHNNMNVAAQELGQNFKEVFGVEETQLESDVKITHGKREENRNYEIEEQYAEIATFLDEDGLRENPDYNFILESAHLNNTLDNNVTDIIFLADDTMDGVGYVEFLTDCKQGKITETLQKEYGGKLGIKGLLKEIADDYEKPFLKKLEEGKTIETQADWERSGPRSSELSRIIDERRQALWLEESIPFRREIYWRLANDYQRFGKECLLQGEDGTQIYYYYVMSIYCCYCALGYAETDENYSDEKILNYIKGRYKDIMDNEAKGIPGTIVNDAEKMYFLMENSGF